MHRIRAVIGTILICLCAGAGPVEPFEFGKEREWDFLNQAKFRGSLVKIEGGKVHIRMADGVVREFWPGNAEGISASFLQHAVCTLPKDPARPNVTPGTGPLIDLAASNLTPGPLTQWKNQGRLGGGFAAMNQPPTVEQVEGRRAVVFAHSPWLLPLDFQTLVSDFYMPDAAIGGSPTTVVAWLFNTGPVVDRETFLCWGEKDCGELDTPDYSYGCYDALQWYSERIVVPPARFPKLNQWHQFAFVLTAVEKNHNVMTLYVDGELVTSKAVRTPPEKLIRNNLAFVGCAWEAWWGHAWATRPARPYTGAIAGLQVYDRALTLPEIRRLDGKDAAAARVSVAAGPTHPEPVAASREIPTTLERLAWTPDPDAVGQVLHFGTDRDAVAKGTASAVKLKPSVEEVFLPLDLKIQTLAPGTTYFWRVEQIFEPKRAPATTGPWSFTTAAFDLEYDGPVSEPFPKDVPQDGFYERFMEAGGYPIISPPGNHDIHLRAARHALQKILGKRPDLLKALQSSNAACHLASREHRGWGWSPFTCSCYGEGEAILREGAIMMHEMGHQFHMQGAEAMEPDFRHRLGQAFDAARRERLWMGDYGGTNMWENVAVCSSWWINDMTQDEGEVRPRELLRRSDPRIYHLLEAYWPGDLMIDLHPTTGVKVDSAGKVLEWGNRGGIEYFKPNVGWRRYERSVGHFNPLAGKPSQRTVDGVTAMAFASSDALAWDQTTWDSLDGNRSWSVDAWVYREGAAAGEQALIEWATPAAPGAKLCWGGRDLAYQLPGGIYGRWTTTAASPGWHHLAWVFAGSGSDQLPGEMRIYLDGKLDGSRQVTLSLPSRARVTVAKALTGAIGRLRVYNYDLHPLQVDGIWRRESPGYLIDPPAVAGRLLVDLDARQLAPADDGETWPLYPATLNKPWLRSWVSRGTLGGKLHNDAGGSLASEPRVGISGSVTAVNFDGKSHMVSDVLGSPPQEGSAELWVRPEAAAQKETVMQWGAWRFTTTSLRPGVWQHVVLTFQSGTVAAWINGTRIGTAPSNVAAGSLADRLVLGGEWDGKTWVNGFNGAVTQLRVHEGVLTPEQIRWNSSNTGVARPSLPEPASRAEVVAERHPALSWQNGFSDADRRCDVYLGTSEQGVVAAARKSSGYLGVKAAGELRPALKPGTQYFWRVDALDAKGQPRLRGAVWSFRTADGLLINLDAAGLAAGPVTQWSNKGASSGMFTPASERELWRPLVVKADGRTGVDFSGRKSLVSSFTTPQALMGSESFTVSIWGYCHDTRGLEREQTMLSWGHRPGDRAEFCWGSDPKRGAFLGAKLELGYRGPATQPDRFRYNAPLLDGWRHVAYSYNGSKHTLRVYVDGKLNREESVTLNIKPGDPICLGGTRTGHTVESPFNGLLGEVAIAGTALDDSEIAQLARGTSSVRANWLVRLDAKGLAEGVLGSWPNLGSLGGEFAPETEHLIAPRAEHVSGRPVVTFDGKGTLCSDLFTPPALTGDHPFTVEMRVLNPKFAETETVFALAPSVAMQSYLNDTNTCAASFNFGEGKDSAKSPRPGVFSSGQGSRNVGWKTTLPTPARWQHLACVYSGGYRGSCTVYLDGQQVQNREYFTLDTIAGYPMYLGGGWNTARGVTTPFSGSLSLLRVYSYARTEQELRQAADER